MLRDVVVIMLGPLMPPCRKCKAAPAEHCTITKSEDKAPLGSVGNYRDPHSIRVRDAKLMSELLDL